RGPGEYRPGERQIAAHDMPFQVASVPAPRVRPGDEPAGAVGGYVSRASYDGRSAARPAVLGLNDNLFRPVLYGGSTGTGLFQGRASYAAEPAIQSGAAGRHLASLAAAGTRAAAKLSAGRPAADAPRRPVLVQ